MEKNTASAALDLKVEKTLVPERPVSPTSCSGLQVCGCSTASAALDFKFVVASTALDFKMEKNTGSRKTYFPALPLESHIDTY
jgi:hypothetical protein